MNAIKLFTNPFFYIAAISVIAIILIGKYKWGWFNKDKGMYHPNGRIEKNNNRTATASTMVQPIDECKKLSDETKYLSDKVKSLMDALQHEEAGNPDVIREFGNVYNMYLDVYGKCLGMSNVLPAVCKNLTCYGV